MDIQIIGCPQWKARKPKQPIDVVGRAKRIIFHHTAGHHAEIENPNDETKAEAIRYAHDIQNYHMDHNGWIDSGHNFLVCRSGLVLQGRWKTITAIQHGNMVVSAHCPGQNTQIGIEHEHLGNEEMTKEQKEASAQLMAWIAHTYGFRKSVLPVFPHSQFFPTACPANLKADIPSIQSRALEILLEEVA